MAGLARSIVPDAADVPFFLAIEAKVRHHVIGYYYGVEDRSVRVDMIIRKVN